MLSGPYPAIYLFLFAHAGAEDPGGGGGGGRGGVLGRSLQPGGPQGLQQSGAPFHIELQKTK